MANPNAEHNVSFPVSIIVLSACVAVMCFCAIGVGTDIHMPLALCCGILLLYGAFMLRIPLAELGKEMVSHVSSGVEVFIILLCIGATIGTWMACGTVPLLIYYGLEIFSPKFFLTSVLIICSIMSIVTGSSWTTLGTLGVAFMGVGAGLGINPAMTAGAIICGSFFGDKQSPMSDSTNYAAAVSGTSLYKHCRSMLYTTGPTMIVAAIIFTVLGLRLEGAVDLTTVQEFQQGLANMFNMSPLLFLPLLLMIVLIVLKVPAIPTMLLAAGVGLLFAIVFQGFSFAEAAKFFCTGFVGNTGNAAIDRLLTRGGISSMYSTIAIMCWSLSMAGLMKRVGIIDAIMAKATKLIRKRQGLITTQLVSGYILTALSADIYLSMILPAQAFGKRYDELGLDRSVLSRTCEDGTTISAPLIPWTTSGVYSAATLGVATLTYLPFYFLGYINIVFVLICAFTGWGMIKAKQSEPESTQSAA